MTKFKIEKLSDPVRIGRNIYEWIAVEQNSGAVYYCTTEQEAVFAVVLYSSAH